MFMQTPYAISKEEINQKPLLEYGGVIHFIRSPEQLLPALQQIRKEKLLGFDTETRPAFRKGESYPPSLLQLAGENEVWLFQLRRFPDLAPLFALLADPSIRKAGVAIRRDLSELRDLCPFEPAGFVDLGIAAENRGFRNTGLRPLAALLLNGRISKKAQTSNWAAEYLDERQLRYAATDAWVSRRLHDLLHPSPQRDENP
jgi:ribonuclease D